MKRGDVVLIQFPFSDLSSSKVRPALVVSSDNYTQKGRDAIFIVISSNIKNVQDTDLLIKSDSPDFPMTGLKTDSLFRTDKIVILSEALAIRQLGTASPGIMKTIDKMLVDVLGIDSKNLQ